MTPATSPGTGVAGTEADAKAVSPRAWALLIAGAIVAAVAAAAYVVALATHPWKDLLDGFDLQVYLGGAHEALHHAASLYTWHYRNDLGIQFTYTPFAALLFAAGLALPFKALMGLVSLASTFALGASVWIAFRELGWHPVATRAGVTLLVTGLAFWTEPVQRALSLGQVELVLMAVVVWDMCQPDRHRWKGTAVGLAAGIKLVPLLFIVYLLLTRRIRAACAAIGAFLLTVAIGFAVLPGPSVHWWMRGDFWEASRTGFVGGQQNQSLRGILTRFTGGVADGQLPWLLAGLVAGVLGLAAAVILWRQGRSFAGLMACALTALLVSPISWDHHWVWIAPGIVVFIDAGVRASRIARAGWLGLAGLVLVIYGGWPDFWRPHGGLLRGGLISYAPGAAFAHGDNPTYPEYHWHGLQLLAGNLYLLAGLGLFVVTLAVAVQQHASCPANHPASPAAFAESG